MSRIEFERTNKDRGLIHLPSRIFDAEPARLVNRYTNYGWTPLHMAVIRSDIKLIQLMLSYGKMSKECVDKRDIRERWKSSGTQRQEFASEKYPHRLVSASTALHYACMVGNMEIVEMLLKAGADYTKDDDRDWLPERYLYEEGGGTKLKDEYKRLVDEEKVRREAAKKDEAPEPADDKSDKSDDSDSSEDSKPEAKPSTTATKQPANKVGMDKDASYTPRERSTFLVRLTLADICPVSIEASIGSKIIGQKGPVRSVANAIRLREHGWVDPDRPLVMLFLGSSGVGKTEVAKQVALYMANKEARTKGQKEKTLTEVEAGNGFIRIDMSEYQQSHTVSNLTGACKGLFVCEKRRC